MAEKKGGSFLFESFFCEESSSVVQGDGNSGQCARPDEKEESDIGCSVGQGNSSFWFNVSVIEGLFLSKDFY